MFQTEEANIDKGNTNLVSGQFSHETEWTWRKLNKGGRSDVSLKYDNAK